MTDHVLDVEDDDLGPDVEVCAYCYHPVTDHGTTEVGCAACSCALSFTGDVR